MALLHSRFLWEWGSWMWQRDHYQFYPLIVLGFVGLIWQRMPEVRWPASPLFSVRVAIYLFASASLFFVAAWLRNGHWLGLIAFLASLWTSVWFFGGKSAADQFRGPMLFLILLVPLPVELDTRCIIELQKVATWLASGVLDLRSVRHTVSGVAIRTSEKTFMVEEACSGIHSLFSALSAMMFLGIFCRYNAIRLLLTAVQTIFWVLVANVFRVFLIVYADARWNIPLDAGWRHDALGFLTYAIVLIFALSTDQLQRFLFPFTKGAMVEVQEDFIKRIVQPWNRFIARTFDDRRLSGRRAVTAMVVTVLLTYLPVGGLVAAQHFMASRESVGEVPASAGAMPEMSENRLPAAVEGWSRGAFESINREAGDILGMSSSVWQYSGYGMNPVVSADGYYSEWHDLAYCYTAIGWELQDAVNGKVMVGELEIPHTRLRLYKNSGESAVVYFSCFDSRKLPVTPPEASRSFMRMLKDRLVSGGLSTAAKSDFDPPVFQIQLLCESRGELLPHELNSLETLFYTARSRVLNEDDAGL